MHTLKKHMVSLSVFSLCAAIVFFIHFTIYQPVIQYRLFNTTEDWPFLIHYKSLYPNPFVKIVDVWTTEGLHISAQIYYIGILSEILGYNYQSYQIVNVILKAIGTLSFFPLTVVIFKNRKLAFLATILFSISSATAGSFLWIVKGSEYLGIALMNIFLITYFYTILKNSYKFLFLSSILILVAYLMAPPRMFPLPFLIPLIEIYWIYKTRKLSNLKYSIIRTVILILPIVLISKPAPVSSMPFTSRPAMLLTDITNGNWHNLLDPFAGIGWTLFTNDFWNFFGTLEIETFKNFGKYLEYLINGPIRVFGLITLILSPVLSKRAVKFFVLVFSLNFILEILIFFIASHHFNIPKELVMIYAPGQFLSTKYPTMMAVYIFVVACACFVEWRKGKERNSLLQAVWVGPLVSAVFLWPTWIIMGPLVNDLISVHWYFGIPAMGTSLFFGAILVLFYGKMKHGMFSGGFAVLAIFGIICLFYQTHEAAIAKQYMGVNPQRIKLADQQIIHEKLINKLPDTAKYGNLLIYLDITSDKSDLRKTSQYYKEALVEVNPGNWIHFRRGKDGVVNNGCIYIITDKKLLRSAIRYRDGERVFIYRGNCVNKEKTNINRAELFYNLKSFYAFKLQNGEFIDIKKELLKELGTH